MYVCVYIYTCIYVRLLYICILYIIFICIHDSGEITFFWWLSEWICLMFFCIWVWWGLTWCLGCDTQINLKRWIFLPKKCGSLGNPSQSPKYEVVGMSEINRGSRWVCHPGGTGIWDSQGIITMGYGVAAIPNPLVKTGRTLPLSFLAYYAYLLSGPISTRNPKKLILRIMVQSNLSDIYCQLFFWK